MLQANLLLLASGALVPALLPSTPRCSIRMSSDPTKPLYSKIEKLIRSSNKSSRVQALSQRWTTLPPDELVENVFVIGKEIVTDYSTGCELLALAEEQADLSLNTRAYAALMRSGQAEERPTDVLMLIARSRALGMQPSRTMLATAMECASQIADWGAVARLFGEYAGSESDTVALELIGASPAVLSEIRTAAETAALDEDEPEQCTIEGDERCTPLAPRDQRAMQLVLRAHCMRGDSPLVAATIKRMRKTMCPIPNEGYAALWDMSDKRALLALTPQDLWLSLSDATELQGLRLSATTGFVSRAERELALIVLGVVVIGLAGYQLNLATIPAEVDPFEASGLF